MAKDGEFTINIDADELKKKLGLASDQVIQEVQSAVKDLANAAYANIVSSAQSKLKRTRLDYLNGLQINTIGPDTYLISLEGLYPNAIENGWNPYDMKEKLLSSSKTVKVGPRAGEPWVRKGKKGQRYARVPFEHRPFSKEAVSGDLSSAIKEFKAVNAKGRIQKFTSVFKDLEGKPLQGKVASVKDTGIANLENVVKYQKTYTNKKTGKQVTSSVYLTYRTVSDLSPSSAWQNSGYAGAHFFKDAEEFVEKEMENIIKSLLG